uniref:Uncharacterized protein n=1 Tax=Cacopsylla melanoneura TaxID=428564 RepID=A0A8D8QBI5_9HEMI
MLEIYFNKPFLSNDPTNEPVIRNDGMRKPKEFPVGQDGLGAGEAIELAIKDDEIRQLNESFMTAKIQLLNYLRHLSQIRITFHFLLSPPTSGYGDCKKC